MQFSYAQSSAPRQADAAYQLPSLFEDHVRLELEAPMGVLALPAGQAIDIDQLLQSPLKDQFKPWQLGMALPTSPGQNVWLRLQIPLQNPPQGWMLRIPRLTLEKATIYQRAPNHHSQWLQQSAGIDVPNIAWPVRARDPVFEISTRSDQSQTIFVQLKNAVPVTENILLIRSSDLINGASHAGTLNGLIVGIFSMMTLISIISWRLNSNSHFGWFALFCFVLMLTQLTISGYMILRAWPGSVYLAKTMGWVLPFCSLAALSRFVMSVTYSKDLSKPNYIGQWLVMGLSILMAIGFLAFPGQFPRSLPNVMFASGMFALLGSLAWIAWRSQYWLWWIFASLLPVVLSALARLAYNLGWVAHMEIALLLGVITATLGLISVYACLVANQRQRAAIAQRENDLEIMDVATGLFNERIALARLPQIILRSKRFHDACGAILVRWVGSESLLASASAVDRGRIFSHLGNRLNRLSREIDTVARVGDDQFLFLIEAPVSHEQLNALASKILTNCLRPSATLPEQKGFDMHIAVWLSSDLPVDAPTVMELLKTRINQMREGTQRRVQFISTPQSTAPTLDQSDPEHAQRLIEKINELEKTHGLPTIDLKTRRVKQNPSEAA